MVEGGRSDALMENNWKHTDRLRRKYVNGMSTESLGEIITLNNVYKIHTYFYKHVLTMAAFSHAMQDVFA